MEWQFYFPAITETTRGCGRWGAARYGAVLAAEKDRRRERPLPW